MRASDRTFHVVSSERVFGEPNREICSHFVDSRHCRTTRVGLAANGSLPAAYPGSPVTAVGR
jgi:hypothetical protein